LLGSKYFDYIILREAKKLFPEAEAGGLISFKHALKGKNLLLLLQGA
jgi:hypothetical protein